MITVGAYEAKTHLSELLEKVARGERVVITKHGVPVASLTATDQHATADVSETIAKLKEFGKGRSLGGISVRDLIEEGRRY